VSGDGVLYVRPANLLQGAGIAEVRSVYNIVVLSFADWISEKPASGNRIAGRT